MKKRKFLWGLAAFSILLTVGSIVLSCTSDTTIPEPDDPENPGTADPDPDDPGTANPDPEDPVVDPVVTKSLEVVSQPSKTVYKVYEYADYTGLVVEKVEYSDGVETSREQVDLADLSMSVAQGEQLTEVNDSLAIRITLLDDAEGEYGSTYIYLKVEDLDQVTVTFKNYDGTTLEQDTIYVSQTTTYDGDTPSRAEEGTYSYRFLGWYVEDDESQTLIDLESYTFDEDTTLIALFQEIDSTYNDGTLTYSYDGSLSGYIVTEYDSSGDTSVVVPDEYNGVPVVGIGDSVFYRQSSITSIKLGVNVKSVGASAFANMTNTSLTIELNEGLETLGEQAFASNTGLTSLVVPGTVTTIPYRCFYSATNITEFTLSEGITTIGQQAFYSFRITDLTLPDSITTLEENAFAYYYYLTNLTIGSGLSGDEFIYSGLFEQGSSSRLASITVSSDSNYLKSDDGYTLLSKDGTVLYGVAKNGGDGIDTTYTIPSSVEEVVYRAFYNFRYSNWNTIQLGENVRVLGDECFSNNSGYVDVLFNEKLEEIGYRSFAYVWGSGYSGTKELVLPDSVTTIGEQAFASCTRLVSVTFGASMQNFGFDMFSSVSTITSYSISSNNTYLSVDGNVVMDAAKTTVKYYLNNTTDVTSFEMPNTVTRVDDGALYGQTTLTNITFSNSLEYIGEKAFYENTGLANNITLPSTLTYIGDEAFYGASNITGINYPGTVTYLGSYAFYNVSSAVFTGNLVVPEGATMGERVFYNCAGLTSMELNVELTSYAFYGATSLQTVKVNYDQTTVPSYAFYNCSSLSTLEMKDGVTTIEQYAFYGTESLEEYKIPSTVETINTHAFDESGIKEAVLPASLTSLGTYAFYNADKLETVEFQGTFEELPTYVFQGTSSLTNLTWPTGLTTINDSAFRGSGLTTVNVPSGVTTIGSSSTSYVFGEMPNLQSAYLPNTVTTLQGYAFAGSANLTSVTLPDGLTSIPDGTFYNCSSFNVSSLPDTISTIGGSALRGTAITEFTLGENVSSLSSTYTFAEATSLETFNWNSTSLTSIPNYTFYNSEKLATFNIGQNASITSIGNYAFQGTAFVSAPFNMTDVTSIGTYAFRASAVEQFVLPTNDSYTSLSNGTFYQCTSLQEIELPSNVTTIGTYAFYQDTSLTKVTIQNPNVSISASSATTAPFRGCTNVSEIYFNGTEEEARAVIEKSTSAGANLFFGSDGPSAVTVYCNNDVTWTYTAS